MKNFYTFGVLLIMHTCWELEELEEAPKKARSGRSPGIRVTRGCELPSMHGGKWTPVLCRAVCALSSSEPFLQPQVYEILSTVAFSSFF